MKRKQLVLLIIIAALGLMAWSGYTNYQRRRHEAAQQHAMQAVLVPDGQQPPASGDETDEEEPSPLLGKAAPGFTLEDLNGHKVSLADYKGKAVLVNFWATWCGPCKIEIPWLIKLRDQYKDQGFEILGVSADDLDKDDKAKLAGDEANIAKAAKSFGIDYPVLLDADSISKPYGGLDALPTSYYVNRKGVIVASVVGLASRDEVEANIKKALAAGGE